MFPIKATNNLDLQIQYISEMLCNMVSVRCFGLLLIFNTIQAIMITPSGSVLKIECRASNEIQEENGTNNIKCCDQVVKQYYETWSLRFYLSSFLKILQTRKCPQFKQECERRTFDFTDFTSLMYSRFCNQSEMEEQCYDDIENIVTKQNNGIQTPTSTYDELVSKLNLSVLSDQDSMNPCVQIAIDPGNHGQYFEIINPEVPFCEAVWCGFNKKIATSKHIAAWNCMPNR